MLLALFDDGAILYHAPSGNTVHLDAAHLNVVESLIGEARTLDQICKSYQTTTGFDNDHEQLQQAVNQLLQQLIEVDVVTKRDHP